MIVQGRYDDSENTKKKINLRDTVNQNTLVGISERGEAEWLPGYGLSNWINAT